MDRILRNTAATISATFSVDGTATDPSPDSATVEILREDGTVLVAAGAATVNAGTGVFSYTLSPTQTALLDKLTARWTATISSASQTLETYVEIVGGFLCSLAQIDNSLNRGGTAGNSTLAVKQAARTVAETAIEQSCNQAFVPRYGRETLDGDGTTDILLANPNVRLVRTASIGGTALSVDELADVLLYTTNGILYRSAKWTSGRLNVAVTYEHGMQSAPADISRATALLAAHMIADGPWDDRGYGVSDDGAAFRLLTAGVSGAMYSIPEVEATVQRYRQPIVA